MAVDTSQAATALLTEHLQYTPLSLIDDIINAVNTYVYQAVSSLEQGLTSAAPERLGFQAVSKDPKSDDGPDYPEAKKEIEEGLHQLETLLESTVDKNFDKFEIYVLRNILSVPEDLAGWVQLSQYEGLTYPTPDNAPTVETIDLLRRKLAESRKVQHALGREQARNEVLKQQLHAITSSMTQDRPANTAVSPDLSFLTTSESAQRLGLSNVKSSQQPLTTSTSFAISQLPTLRAALADLRPKLANIQSSKPETAKDEQRQERREYIEHRTKAQLERIGYVRPEDADALRGHRTETEEVEALEKAAELLSRS